MVKDLLLETLGIVGCSAAIDARDDRIVIFIFADTENLSRWEEKFCSIEVYRESILLNLKRASEEPRLTTWGDVDELIGKAIIFKGPFEVGSGYLLKINWDGMNIEAPFVVRATNKNKEE